MRHPRRNLLFYVRGGKSVKLTKASWTSFDFIHAVELIGVGQSQVLTSTKRLSRIEGFALMWSLRLIYGDCDAASIGRLRGALHVSLDHCMREVEARRFRFVPRSTYDQLSELLVAWKRSGVESMYVAYREHDRPGRMLGWMARVAELHGVGVCAAKSRQRSRASGRLWGRGPSLFWYVGAVWRDTRSTQHASQPGRVR